MIRLFGDFTDPEFALPPHGDSEPSVAQLIEIDDPGLGADLKEFRTVAARPPGIAAGADQHHAERRVFAHAAADHVQITGLEDLQRQHAALEEHGAQGKQRNFCAQRIHAHTLHPLTEPRGLVPGD